MEIAEIHIDLMNRKLFDCNTLIEQIIEKYKLYEIKLMVVYLMN